MKRGGVLNRELNRVIGSLGHGQYLIVSDAGFPVPPATECIDLSITRGYPEIPFVLEALHREVIIERVMFASDMIRLNHNLYEEVARIFADSDLDPVDHRRILGDIAREAVAVVRTGDYNPWGNIVLVAGTDPYAWFDREGTVVPEFYLHRRQMVEKAGRRSSFYPHV